MLFTRWLAAALLALCGSAHAAYTVNIQESGGNVVISGSGSLNTTGLTLVPSSTTCGSGSGGLDSITVCSGSGLSGFTATGAVSPPLSGLLSSPGAYLASSASGASVIIFGSTLYLPPGYTSGAALSNTSTITGATFAALGLTPRTITLNIPNDTIVINIGVSATGIPTLDTYGLLGLAGLLALAGWGRMRRRSA